jgi:fermentation-respiration switch protein FrsA (DUF1100 family)
MGIVLRKSFKGNHVWIPAASPDGVKIDAMFFTANEQPLVLDSSNQTRNNTQYLSNDTFILCNPNAMSYQHMINYPHAFYLKYFLGKQINCLIWNYRGYGRTKGKPHPSMFEKDAEQVLGYLKNTIGVKGKIGVYGRSLGCIPATYLQDKVDMIIADRGFSDLWTLAEKKFYSTISSSLIKYGTFGW